MKNEEMKNEEMKKYYQPTQNPKLKTQNSKHQNEGMKE